MALATDGDLALLHHFEQRRLDLGGARLISSASRKLQNTGPSSVSNEPVDGR